MSSLEDLRNQIKTLKSSLKEKQNVFRQSKGLLTEADLHNKSVKELRRIVVDNKIFKGITRMKKRQLIEGIINSGWFEKQPPSLPKNPPLALQKKKEVKKEKVKLEELEEELPEKEEIEEEKPSTLEITEKETKKSRRKKLKLDEDTDDEDDEDNKHLSFKKDKDGQKKLDIGHTVVNVYCNGSNNPNFPVPQSVVRHALNANQLPLQQQQQLGQVLREEAKQAPVIQGIPQQAIPRPVPHKSHRSLKDIQSRFNKPDIKKVKKFPPVKTTKPLKKIVEPVEEIKKEKSRFEDDDEEEETKEEKIKRERQEEITKEFSRAKKKGFNDKFKNRLEGIFSQRLQQKKEDK